MSKCMRCQAPMDAGVIGQQRLQVIDPQTATVVGWVCHRHVTLARNCGFAVRVKQHEYQRGEMRDQPPASEEVVW